MCLDLSHLESGKLPINPINFDYHAAVLDALRVVRANAEEKNLTLGSAIAADVPRRIHGDQNRVQQIIVNLLGNAIKFTEAGGVSVTVSLSLSAPPMIRTEVRGYRHRHRRRGAEKSLQGIFARGRFHLRPLWRQRPRPVDQQAARRIDGRRDGIAQ